MFTLDRADASCYAQGAYGSIADGGAVFQGGSNTIWLALGLTLGLASASACGGDDTGAATDTDGETGATSTGDTSDGSTVDDATGSDFSSVRLATIRFGVQSEVLSVSLSADGQQLITGHLDGVARLWDVTGGTLLQAFPGHAGWVSSVAIAPDGRSALTCDYDAVARLWSTRTGDLMRTVPGGMSRGWCNAVFSPDGTRILMAGGVYDDGTESRSLYAALTDVSTGVRRDPFVLLGEGEILDAAYSPDGKLILMGLTEYDANTESDKGGALLLDVHSGVTVRNFIADMDRVISVAFSPDGRYAMTGCDDGVVKIWDSVTGAAIRDLIGHTNTVSGLSISPDGRRVLTASWDGTVRVWDFDTGTQVGEFPQLEDVPRGAFFSPDGNQALLVEQSSATIWDMSEWNE